MVLLPGIRHSGCHSWGMQATAALEQADKAMLRQWLEQLPAEVLAARNVRPVHTYLEGFAKRQVMHPAPFCGCMAMRLS